MKNVLLKVVLPLLSLGLFAVAVCHVELRRERYPLVPPPKEPTRSPFARAIAARGTVEPETEIIEIGSPVPGIVIAVCVRPGEHVKVGDPLFRLEDRQLLAELKVREEALKVANAQLDCLDSQPRPEEVTIAQARVRKAESHFAACEDEAKRLEGLGPSGTSQGAMFAGRQSAHAAQAELEQARGELKLLTCGVWPPTRKVHLALVAQAEAALDQTRTELDRLVIRAPICGEVLHVNVHPGEFLSTPPVRPTVTLGSTRRLHVRVDVDEHDIARFRPTAQSKGIMVGRSEVAFALEYVRVERIVVPKSALSGLDREVVDTRVLQAIYRVDPEHAPSLYVGQQLDVYIEE